MQCEAVTIKGQRCKRPALDQHGTMTGLEDSVLCHMHLNQLYKRGKIETVKGTLRLKPDKKK